MRVILIAVVCAMLTGCGESAKSRQDRAASQVNTVARRFGERVDEAGYYQRVTDSLEVDPWGNKLMLEYKRSGIRESLTVRSCGGDGLPYTRDDIVAHDNLDNGKIRAALRKDRQSAVNGYGEAAGHGLTRGVSEAIGEIKGKTK